MNFKKIGIIIFAVLFLIAAVDDEGIEDIVDIENIEEIKDIEEIAEEERMPITIRMVPTELRPPQNVRMPDIPEAEIVPPIERDLHSPRLTQTDTPAVASIAGETSTPSAENWYVQIVTYTNKNNVEFDINRIGLPDLFTVQRTGSDTNPQFRVLLGPFNQGESRAWLSRVKNLGYKDAFLRKR